MYLSSKNGKAKVLDNGVKRTIMANDANLMLVKFEFKKGQVGALHSHIHAQSSYILKGKFEFEIEGTKYTCTEGDTLVVAPNASHGCVCLEEGVLIDTFSPTREDFLKEQ